jgi:hypothetical protein
VCYDFPPNQGIGGRRWAKLAKALAQSGTEVHVIKADPVSNNKPSPWTADVAHPNIRAHSLPRTYPEAVNRPKPGLWGSLTFRWHLWQLKQKTGGTPFDVSVGWEKAFRKAAHEIIESHDIHHVLATGAPFHLLAEAVRLKAHHSGLKVLCDYRDPWMTAVNYGMPGLSPERMAFEKALQHEIFIKADIVTAVNEFMLEEIVQSDTAPEEALCRFEVIPHFYDAADLEKYVALSKPDGDGKIRFIYGGALYMDLEPHFERMNAWLSDLKTRMPALYARLEFRMFTPDLRFRVFFKEHAEAVQINESIGNRLFEEVAAADYLLVFSADHNREYLTTKYMEYMPFRKPLVHIGSKGFCSRFTMENGTGISVDDFRADLEPVLTGTRSFRPNPAYDITRHELKRVTEQLIRLLS